MLRDGKLNFFLSVAERDKREREREREREQWRKNSIAWRTEQVQ